MGIHESVLDGRNRLRACELAGVEPLTCVRDDIASPTTFVLSLNLHRRHLTPAQRAALGVDVSESFAAEAAERHRQASVKGGSAERKAGTDSVPASTAPERDPDARALTQAAKAVGAGREATERMAAVQRDAPEVFAAVKSGAITTVTDAKRGLESAAVALVKERDAPVPHDAHGRLKRF